MNPVLVLLPGPAQRGVRSSSLYTFLILLKVLVLHSSVTIFTTNFLLSHFPPPAESSTSLASPFQKTSLLFFHSEMFSQSLKSLSKFDSQTTCRLTPTPSDDTLTASHFQTWLLTVQTEKKNCCLFFFRSAAASVSRAGQQMKESGSPRSSLGSGHELEMWRARKRFC